jgi:hypothetical protein
MTEEERQRRAKVLLEYEECKQSLAVLKKTASDIAALFDELSHRLRVNPAELVTFVAEIPSRENIRELAIKAQKAEIAFAALDRTKKQMGYGD